MPPSYHFLEHEVSFTAVLPVLAIATTSFPVNATGILAFWMGVGSLYPMRNTPDKIALLSPIFWKEPFFFALDLGALSPHYRHSKTNVAEVEDSCNSSIFFSSISSSTMLANSFSRISI